MHNTTFIVLIFLFSILQKIVSITMETSFDDSCKKFDEIRASFLQRKSKPHEFEFLVNFDKITCTLWALKQQAIQGDLNVSKENFMDETELSWMWSWIKGNQKWHAWNKIKGMSKTNAKSLFVEELKKLEEQLPELQEKWSNEFLKP